jgi:hypothetical protein
VRNGACTVSATAQRANGSRVSSTGVKTCVRRECGGACDAGVRFGSNFLGRTTSSSAIAVARMSTQSDSSVGLSRVGRVGAWKGDSTLRTCKHWSGRSRAGTLKCPSVSIKCLVSLTATAFHTFVYAQKQSSKAVRDGQPRRRDGRRGKKAMDQRNRNRGLLKYKPRS